MQVLARPIISLGALTRQDGSLGTLELGVGGHLVELGLFPLR